MIKFPTVVIRPWGYGGPEKAMVRAHLMAYLIETQAGDPTEANVDLLWDRGIRAADAGYPTLVATVDDDGGDQVPCSIYLVAPPAGGLTSSLVSTAEVVLAYTLPQFRRQGIREAVRELALRWLRRMEVGLVMGAARYTDQGAVEDLRKHGAEPTLVIWSRKP